MKSLDQWFAEYGESHQNATNKMIHWICVPVIFFCVIALFSSIPSEGLKGLFPPSLSPFIHWGTVVLVLGWIFYLRLSFTMFLGIALFSILCLYGVILLESLPIPVWQSSLFLFTLAWIGQFIGHKIEGKKPSFLKDLQFLLIGPAWLMGFLFRKLRIRY